MSLSELVEKNYNYTELNNTIDDKIKRTKFALFLNNVVSISERYGLGSVGSGILYHTINHPPEAALGEQLLVLLGSSIVFTMGVTLTYQSFIDEEKNKKERQNIKDCLKELRETKSELLENAAHNESPYVPIPMLEKLQMMRIIP